MFTQGAFPFSENKARKRGIEKRPLDPIRAATVSTHCLSTHETGFSIPPSKIKGFRDFSLIL